MADMYDVTYDGARNLLHFTLRGFWTLETVTSLAVELRSTAQRIHRVHQNFDVLSDASDFPVQSADVSAAMGNIMKIAVTMTTGRMAIVVGSTLNKLQAERELAHPALKVFLDVDEAQKWLRMKPSRA